MNSAAELFTDFSTDEKLSRQPHTKMEQIMRKTSLAIVISELIKWYVHD